MKEAKPLKDLYRVFEAARSFEGDTAKQASDKLNVSRQFLRHFFRGWGSSAPLEKKVRAYIKNSGLYKHIEDMGLDPESTKDDLINEDEHSLDPQHS